MMNKDELLAHACRQIRAEGEAIIEVATQLDEQFMELVYWVSQCEGQVLITGSGTSGGIGLRMAHLLATCSIKSFFIHPADALHGPSAVVSNEDILIVISKAGKSADINQFVRIAKARGARIASLTWYEDSPLAILSDLVVIVRSGEKGEGEGVLPLGSSLANGAVGDALCLLVRRIKGFELSELKQTHPSGATSELV